MGPTAILIVLGGFRITIWDSVFALFVLWLAVSTAANGLGPLKEEVLLILSLAAYPAARLSGAAGRGFFIVLGVTGLLGLASIAGALQAQWGDIHGKPLVFGMFDAAPAQIFICFALLMLGLVASHLDRSWLVMGYSAAGAAFAILSASLVRFSFLALICVLLCEAVISRRTRAKALVAILVVSASWGAGYYARVSTAEHLAVSMAAPPLARSTEGSPTSCIDLEHYNSVFVRAKLLSDVAAALPHAGLFGQGLSSFTRMTCLGIESHISAAQLVIEFGWPAGALIVCVVFGPLLTAVRLDRPEASFVLMAFLFAAALTFAHGNLARDGLFFLLLGYLVRITTPVERAGALMLRDDRAAKGAAASPDAFDS